MGLVNEMVGEILMVFKRCSLVPTIAAVGLIIWGSLTAKFNIGFWGLFGGFPITYYIGLAGLGLSFVLALRDERPSRILLGCQLLAFVTALWLIPVSIGSPPGLPMAYYNLGI